jgi:hypothetical protein
MPSCSPPFPESFNSVLCCFEIMTALLSTTPPDALEIDMLKTILHVLSTYERFLSNLGCRSAQESAVMLTLSAWVVNHSQTADLIKEETKILADIITSRLSFLRLESTRWSDTHSVSKALCSLALSLLDCLGSDSVKPIVSKHASLLETLRRQFLNGILNADCILRKIVEDWLQKPEGTDKGGAQEDEVSAHVIASICSLMASEKLRRAVPRDCRVSMTAVCTELKKALTEFHHSDSCAERLVQTCLLYWQDHCREHIPGSVDIPFLTPKLDLLLFLIFTLGSDEDVAGLICWVLEASSSRNIKVSVFSSVLILGRSVSLFLISPCGSVGQLHISGVVRLTRDVLVMLNPMSNPMSEHRSQLDPVSIPPEVCLLSIFCWNRSLEGWLPPTLLPDAALYPPGLEYFYANLEFPTLMFALLETTRALDCATQSPTLRQHVACPWILSIAHTMLVATCVRIHRCLEDLDARENTWTSLRDAFQTMSSPAFVPTTAMGPRAHNSTSVNDSSNECCKSACLMAYLQLRSEAEATLADENRSGDKLYGVSCSTVSQLLKLGENLSLYPALIHHSARWTVSGIGVILMGACLRAACAWDSGQHGWEPLDRYVMFSVDNSLPSLL